MSLAERVAEAPTDTDFTGSNALHQFRQADVKRPGDDFDVV